MRTRILLVDDETDVLTWMKSRLESCDYEVETSTDGLQAIQRARATKPDLILLDFDMGSLSGPEACEKLRQDSVTRSIPVILLAAHDQLSQKVEGLNRGADDYVVKSADPIVIKTRIDNLVRHNEDYSNAHPLTKLPGKVAVDHEVARRLETGERFSVGYCNIDHFKAYNDGYGYKAGDRVLLHTGRLLVETLEEFGRSEDFVGHISGDDFAFFTIPDLEEDVCRAIIARFEKTIPSFYCEEDRQRGLIAIEGRSGERETHPLMTITIALVNNVRKHFDSPHIVSERGIEIINYLKQFEGSNYLSDRRGTDRVDWRRRIEAHRKAYEARRRKTDSRAPREPRQNKIH